MSAPQSVNSPLLRRYLEEIEDGIVEEVLARYRRRRVRARVENAIERVRATLAAYNPLDAGVAVTAATDFADGIVGRRWPKGSAGRRRADELARAIASRALFLICAERKIARLRVIERNAEGGAE